MTTVDIERLRQVKTLPSLIKFLRDELDWPIEFEEIDDITFDYSPEELGIDARHAAKIKEIKQLRPLESNQPWGIFWVSFEKKRLPMVVLRRILGNLIIKRRAGTRKSDRPSWHLNDLLFISSYGEEEHRNLSFAHFTEEPGTDELPVLRVLGWDDQNSIMNLDRVANRLHSHFRWPDYSEDVNAWRTRWCDAFTDRYHEAIRSAEELIPRLASLAAGVRRRVRDVLDAETESGPMRRLFAAVQKLLIHDMNEDGFADMYAQTVAYGLLSARFSRPAGLTAQNLVQLTAVSNPFLENLLENLFRLNRGKFHFDVDEVGINDVLDLLRNTNIESIKAAFSDKNPAEDPVIRFYEGFLKQYDPQQRIKRGVFFTPRPVVSYIVRSVHELLQTEFGLEDGLASTETWADMRRRIPEITIPSGVKPGDPFVCILDPAVGTGTFLFECIEVIERTMKDKWLRELGKQNWNDPEILRRWREYVPKHLLPRLYGYELMMAPYSIAHLKLALKLGETGYQFREGDRLHIYLTNSLEPSLKLPGDWIADMFITLATEAQEVNKVKANKRFTVVIGNPPYSVSSWNKGEWIMSLVEDYKRTVRRQESQIQSLSNDYIKFLRFTEWLLEQARCGLLGMITGHGYLLGTQPRDLRRHISATFGRCYCLDLHGSIRRNGTEDPDDEPVFQIMTGVAIIVGSRSPSLGGFGETRQASLTGSLARKFRFLLETTATTATSESPAHRPLEPYYYFSPGTTTLAVSEEFRSFHDLPSLFGSGDRHNDKETYWATGFTSQQDELAVAFSRDELTERMTALATSKSFGDLRQTYRLCTTNQWNYDEARAFAAKGLWRPHVRQVMYRPFDRRWTVLHKHVLTILRNQVMSQLDDTTGRNLGLVSSRAVNDMKFAHCFVVNERVDRTFLSSKTSTNAYVFPLYFSEQNLLGSNRRPNLSRKFLSALARRIDFVNNTPSGLSQHISPENIFHYIYAIFHSPTYRTRYAEFLKIDFPRLPLTSSLELFRALSALGGELVALHLMESSKLDEFITQWRGSTPSGEVEKVTYSDETVWINKAKTEGFRGVPEDVWNFHIGGYQVCEKWLKDRKRRPLSGEDITHYQKIVVALRETIRIMGEIDEVIEEHGGWPGAFATSQD